MAYIYMDESGDLGLDSSGRKTSRHFIVTFLFTTRPRPVGKIAKKVVRGFIKQRKSGHSGVLHAHKELPITRQRTLFAMSQQDISILAIYLDKQRIYTKLPEEKQAIYSYITNILLDRIVTKGLIPIDRPIKLIASRRETNKFFNDNFSRYLEERVVAKHKLRLSVEIKSPQEDKCLQIVDMASWAIFRKREHDDESYYNLIRSKIVEESPLFP